MGKLFIFASIVLSAVTFCRAQAAESFDIATFQVPSGWSKQVKEGALILSTSDAKAGSFALITLYPSSPSNGQPKGNFDSDWRAIAAPLGIKTQPEMEPQKQVDGWTITTGGAGFTGDLGPAAIILQTATGYGRKFSCTAIFNNQAYTPAIEAFASSMVLTKAAPPGDAPAPAQNVDTSILGTWGKNTGSHMTYGDPVAAGMAGYSKDQYTFNPNGTYTFVSKTFRMAYDKIILVKENGTYQISGQTLSIRPQKSVIEAWSKLNGGDKFGRMLTSQARKLEPVNYRFTRHYFSGIDQWQLVLQGDAPTERDGPFSTFTVFTNAWYYSPISANNPVVVLP